MRLSSGKFSGGAPAAGQKNRRQGWLIALALAAICAFRPALPAQAVDLGADPYIKAPPYQPPPLAAMPAAPYTPPPPAHSAASHQPYAPAPLRYRPHRFNDPARESQHILWCRQNHPSYNQTSNTYRPFDKAGTMPPQARIPCVSPYSR